MNFTNPNACDRGKVTWLHGFRASCQVGKESVVTQFVHDVTQECKDSLEDREKKALRVNIVNASLLTGCIKAYSKSCLHKRGCLKAVRFLVWGILCLT